MPAVKRVRLSLKPPRSVARTAARGLALRALLGWGGTAVGLARAHQLAAQETLSPETIFRMVSYFARHEVDKRAPGWRNAKRRSPGYVAWQLWGGEPGRRWAQTVKRQLGH
jgi:hypothetical protein